MTDQEYFARDGINQTTLKAALRSLLHYKYARSHQSAPSPSMQFGRAVHAAVLKPKLFKAEYVSIRDRRTAEGKAAAAAAEAAGKTILAADDHARVCEMASAIRAQAKDMLRGRKEVPYFWTDAGTGLKLKAKLDIVGENRIVDLKTSTSAALEDFKREAWRYRYDLQAAFYQAAIEAKTGKIVPFFFIVAEKEPPYGVSIFRASDAFTDMGNWTMRELLHKVSECEESGIWPGYSEGVLDLPAWAEG